MNLMSIANRTVVVAVPDTSVQTAAQLMREHHVGALVIMSPDSDDALPIGMLTDRFGPRIMYSFLLAVCSIPCFMFAFADTFAQAGILSGFPRRKADAPAA